MHIHGNLNNVQATSLNAACNARTENAEKAAQTRKRLHKAAEILDDPSVDASDPGAGFLVGEWLNVHHNLAMADDAYNRRS